MTHPTDSLRLVPVEPTAKMAQVARDAIHAAQVQGWAGLDPIDIYRAMLAASPTSPLPGGGWQDISTAPKDGTLIDVWRDEGGRDTVFWGMPHHDCGEAGQYCDSDWHSIRAPGWICNTFHEFVGRNHNPFTHWMPLPAAPTGAK